MVGQETIRIARVLGFAAACGITSGVSAQDAKTAPNAEQHCPAKPAQDESLRSREKPLELPGEWKAFAGSAKDWIAVRTQLGSVHCIDTTWQDQADGFEKLSDRFLGYAWGGYEAWGYMLIDTAHTGTSMDVGAKPIFSPSGYRFAALQVSEAGWGGFEGFAIWRTYEGGIVPEHVDTQLYGSADWKFDRWEGDDCVHLSAIPYERITDWEKLSEYPRDTYIASSRSGWKLTPGTACPTS